MRSTALCVAFILIRGVLVTLSAAPLGAARPTLVVRTYETTHTERASWSAAVETAAALLAQAGIRIEWVQCSSLHAGEPYNGPARCEMPYERNEVALRIVRRPAIEPRDRLLLGDSLVDESSRSGTLATVYLDHVEALARAAGVPADLVMARAMAHELGHLVLGTSTHSARGLMRPTWTPEELTRNRPVDWSIPADDGARMRQGLRRRIESPVLTRMIDGCPASGSSARSDSCSKPTS